MGCDKKTRFSNGYGRKLIASCIMVYGGSIHSGKWKGESLNIVSAFEALGKKFNNTIAPEDFKGDSKLSWCRSLWRNVYCVLCLHLLKL
jgi:dihydroxy-acid dehydratase